MKKKSERVFFFTLTKKRLKESDRKGMYKEETKKHCYTKGWEWWVKIKEVEWISCQVRGYIIIYGYKNT